MNKRITISSDGKILDLNRHFKVIAGPGAGKTHWLIGHIKNVLQNASNFTANSRIACITYTAVGAEEMSKRLGANTDRVDISTIHSFLYINVVKPYVHLLVDENNERIVNVEKLDGHFENIATGGKIFQWQKEVNNLRYINNKEEIKECLESLDWILEEGSFILKPRKDYKRRVGNYSIKVEDLPVYKQLHWNEGMIHHEDVLYFSYKILEKYPMILEHLSAKYPFMFIDEFQDTSPIQAEIVKWLGSTGTVIGVIGDPAQSIYRFQGASRQDFIDFYLPNQMELEIENNRRSGTKIVNLINHLRTGDSLIQKCTRKNSANEVQIIECTGDVKQTIKHFHDLRGELRLNKDYCILTRNNNTVKIINEVEVTEVWSDFSGIDEDRERLLKALLTAYRLVKDNRNDVAIKEIIRHLKTNRKGILKAPFQKDQYISEISKRGLAVDILEFIVTEINQSLNLTLYNFYNSLNDFTKKKGFSLKNVIKSRFKDFSETILISELLNNIILPEERTSKIRTIHKAKGAEFESVLLYLTDLSDVEKIIKPQIESEKSDDSRILYVALSRAEDFLCIACPPLGSEMKKELDAINIVNTLNLHIN